MKFSIVINTYNRINQLKDCLKSLKYLEGEFEVIVVNGPSDDGTEEFLLEYQSHIKHIKCKDRNLSVSRNLGIANADGEIVAFIDDDAVVHRKWLLELEKTYRESEKIYGVGGFTIDHTGRAYQARSTLCDRLGNAYPVSTEIPAESFCFKGSALFPSLLGTNSSFRMSALKNIGGFDENFAYFLDETDVCLRLIDSGGIIKYNPNAIIYHRYAPSHLRNMNKVPRTLFIPARSKVYYMLRHGTKSYGSNYVYDEIKKYEQGLNKDNKWLADNGLLSTTTEHLLNQDVSFAITEAEKSFRQVPATNLLKRLEADRQSQKYKKYNNDNKKSCFVFVTQGYPPNDTAGIARWTEHVAKGLASRGYVIHIITKAIKNESTDFVDGVWIHQINPKQDKYTEQLTKNFDVPSSVLDWSAAVFNEIESIGYENIDLVSAPIWDVEGLIPLVSQKIPLVVSLHTTYKLALPFKPDWQRPAYYHNHVEKIIKAEKYVLKNAKFLLANSHAIIKDIESHYGISISEKCFIAPHGIDKPTLFQNKPNSQKITVLFVGRQESRKGFDSALLAAIDVCRKTSDVNFRFIGSPTNDYKCNQAIKNLHQNVEKDIINRISLEGYVSDHELEDAYANCDIFIAPSRYESFGLIAIEAMRYAKPVIAGNVGGLKEVIKNEHDGFLINPESYTDISASLEVLIKNDNLRKEIGHNALLSYQNKFTVEKMIDNIEHSYNTFLSREVKNG